MADTLLERFLAVQVAEAAANYTHADEPLTPGYRAGGDDRREGLPCHMHDDEAFWRVALQRERDGARSLRFQCYRAVMTEWVARVPGLYWHPGSARMRNVHPAQIEADIGEWRTYKPQGKSLLVSGGVGTLRFPPATDGVRLVTITTTHNASAGVPALVSPEFWERWKLAEGCIVNMSDAVWRPMPLEWAVQFPVIRGIERGCLDLSKASRFEVMQWDAPVQVHPYSIMEYWNGSVQLHDFVYATGDTSVRSFRSDLSRFFENYRNDKGRDGIYLTTSDIADPMWNATFANPAEMRGSKGPQLRLIEKRAEEAVAGEEYINALLSTLSNFLHQGDLFRLSEKAGIPSQRWSTPGISIGEQAARLVDTAVQMNKRQALLHTVMLEPSQ